MTAGMTEAGRLIGGELTQVRARKVEMTQRLLGDTIRLSDQQWQEPSLLPGWTRAHVATHVARNADGFSRALEALRSRRSQRMYVSEADRQSAIERGSQRSGLDLQIDLDTSAGHLMRVFDEIEQLNPEDPIELRAGFRVPVGLLPLARLNEVVLHHVDLDVGFTTGDIPLNIARWLVEWTLLRLENRADVPAMTLTSESGLSARVGGFGDPITVHGDDQALLGWLTGRTAGDGVEGASPVSLPLLG